MKHGEPITSASARRARDGPARAFAVDSTTMVNELQTRHDTDPAVTAALGRLATGTLLFGAMLKEEDQLVTVRVRGDGPAGVLLASTNGNGEVRGLVANPRPDIPQGHETASSTCPARSVHWDSSRSPAISACVSRMSARLKSCQGR